LAIGDHLHGAARCGALSTLSPGDPMQPKEPTPVPQIIPLLEAVAR